MDQLVRQRTLALHCCRNCTSFAARWKFWPAAVECGVSSVMVDFRNLSECGEAVRMARRHAVEILLATPRIHRPGEYGVLERLAELEPDGLLVRNLAGLAFCRQRGLPAVADFSLNAANELSVAWLHAGGAQRVTAAYDLSRRQLLDLAAAVPPEWLEVVVHRHTPMFHSELLPLLRAALAGTQSGRLRPAVPRTRGAAARSAGRRASVGDRQPMPQHVVPRRGRESRVEQCPAWCAGIRHFRLELLAGKDLKELPRLRAALRST